MKIVALAGGVGGAKLVDGLSRLLPPEDFCVIVNTGDDFEHLSLKISPDLDTICYTLGNRDNPKTGWGLEDETWVVFKHIAELGGPDWFRLGDKDLATHLIRTHQLGQGKPLSEITRDLCTHWGVRHAVFPMCDEPVRTIVHTADGKSLGFQEYFVLLRCQPEVKFFRFTGIEDSKPVPHALRRIEESDLVILAPSNPWVSIDPILAVPGYRKLIAQKPVLAVSPLIGGKAVKGPAAKMYRELGVQPSASAVAEHYRDLLSGFIFDHVDRKELEKIEGWRIMSYVTDILMNNKVDRVRLAKEVLVFGESILSRRF